MLHLLNAFVEQKQLEADRASLGRDNAGRFVYKLNDPRAKYYGTPRKETMLKLATNSPPNGSFVELGVSKGDSAWRLADLAKIQGRECYLFDAFRGINVELIKRRIPTAIFCAGLFPRSMASNIGPMAFVHVDFESYDSCLAAMDKLIPKLVVGGVMLFDDYNVNPDVRKAVDTTLGSKNLYITRELKAYFVNV